MFERVSLRGRVSPNKIPGDLLRLRADETLAQTKPFLPCAAGRTIEVIQASQPAAISTSCGRLAAFTRRFVFTIAHLSKDAMRVANASTNQSSSSSGGDLFT